MFSNTMIREVHCKVERFAAEHSIPICVHNFEYIEERSRVRDVLVCTLLGRFAVLEEAEEIVTFTTPSDWWEALKERWFPRWALRLWPVVSKVWSKKVTARALLPNVACDMPDVTIRYFTEQL